MKLIRSGALMVLAALVLSACAERDVILPGERLDVRTPFNGEGATVENRAKPIRLGKAVRNDAWPQRAGSAENRIRQPAFSVAPQLAWAAPIGEGNDRRHRITADPVSAGGRVFTLDSRATVSAFSLEGAPVWSRDLTPPGENPDDASGGGLAVAGGRLFVTTGFGELVALDAATGAVNWRQRLDAPAAGAPTLASGTVFVVTRDSRAIAVDAANGRELWQLQGVPSPAGVVGGAAPAVSGRLVIFPLPSTELVAAFRRGGMQVWSGSVAGGRLGRAYARISDVTGDPVVKGQVVYAGNSSGRTVALDLTTGEPVWSAPEGATGPVWVEGGSVFLVSDRAELVRLDARNGRRIWAAELPDFVPARNQRRLRDVYANYGPVLAGGRLWVASGDGRLRGFDPVDGRLSASVELPGGAATRPIVVRGTMYVVSRDGQLLAFR